MAPPRAVPRMCGNRLGALHWNRSSDVSGKKPGETYLVLVLALSTVCGMAVSIAVYYGWSKGAILPGLRHPLTATSLLFCPPFILSLEVAPVADSPLSLTLVLGTIIFANAFLYAGVAAALYSVVSTMVKHRRARVA
jgi:hypothetical protein